MQHYITSVSGGLLDRKNYYTGNAESKSFASPLKNLGEKTILVEEDSCRNDSYRQHTKYNDKIDRHYSTYDLGILLENKDSYLGDNKQYMSTRIRGNTEKIPFYDIEEMGKEAWEVATGVKVVYYLESSNIAGTKANVFQRYQHKQYKVFSNFLEDNNAYEHMNPEIKERYDSMLKDITKAMDEYGDGGYNGISRKSMLLSQNMIAQLEFFNTNYVPDYLQNDFQKLIEECDYFNQSSREKMFADRMPCDIVLKGLGDGLVNKEKSAVVRNYLEYSRREKDEIRELFSDLKGKRNLSDIYVTLQNLEKWYCRYDANADAKNIFSIMKTSWKKLI